MRIENRRLKTEKGLKERSGRYALCAMLLIIGENLRLKLFVSLAQPKADPSSGGLWREKSY